MSGDQWRLQARPGTGGTGVRSRPAGALTSLAADLSTCWESSSVTDGVGKASVEA